MRRAAGLTREQTADRVHQVGGPKTVTAAAMSNIESGRLGRDGRWTRSITVDELVAFAAVFEIPPVSLLDAPGCDTCADAAPRGFTCNTCGRSGK